MIDDVAPDDPGTLLIGAVVGLGPLLVDPGDGLFAADIESEHHLGDEIAAEVEGLSISRTRKLFHVPQDRRRPETTATPNLYASCASCGGAYMVTPARARQYQGPVPGATLDAQIRAASR